MSPSYVTKHKGLDYGPRQGTLGLSYHMTEGSGGIGDVLFLTQRAGESRSQWANRVNGVSAHIVLTDDGTLYQMVDFDNACGNLNPADRADEYGYYGHDSLVDVLGTHWPDPNAWNVSMEIAGKRADGPTDAQVVSAVAWGLDMRKRFPTIRGANGHHDQSPKPCPGLKANMKAIFDGVGGHGLFTEDDVRKVTRRAGPTGSFTIKKPNIGYQYLELRTDTQKPADWTNERTGAVPVTIDPPLGGGTGNRKDGYHWVGGEAAFILATDVDFVPDPEPIDCATQVAEAVAATKASAHITDPSISF